MTYTRGKPYPPLKPLSERELLRRTEATVELGRLMVKYRLIAARIMFSVGGPDEFGEGRDEGA